MWSLSRWLTVALVFDAPPTFNQTGIVGEVVLHIDTSVPHRKSLR
jgi:hypothetical protein